MSIRTGRGAGRPPNIPVELSDPSLISIALYFLKQVRDKSATNPAIGYLTSLQSMKTR